MKLVSRSNDGAASNAQLVLQSRLNPALKRRDVTSVIGCEHDVAAGEDQGYASEPRATNTSRNFSLRMFGLPGPILLSRVACLVIARTLAGAMSELAARAPTRGRFRQHSGM